MRRSARASSFAASLELAREGKIELRQDEGLRADLAAPPCPASAPREAAACGPQSQDEARHGPDERPQAERRATCSNLIRRRASRPRTCGSPRRWFSPQRSRWRNPTIAQRLSEGADVGAVMEELRRLYEGRGVNLVRVAGRWMFRTADDLAWALAPRPRREAQALARGARNARHRRLSPARHPRRHRANPRRGGVEGRARRADGGALGAHAGTPKGAGPADHLRHDDRLSGRVRT